MTAIVNYELTPGWDAGARSIASFSGDGSASWTVGQAVGIVCGLTDNDISAHYTDIKHGFFIESGKYRIIESGVIKTTEESYPECAIFTVERLNGVVRYYVRECGADGNGDGSDGSIYLTGLWTHSTHPYYGYSILTVNTEHPSYDASAFTLNHGDTFYLITDTDSTDYLRFEFEVNDFPLEAGRHFTNPQPYPGGLFISSYTHNIMEDGVDNKLKRIHTGQTLYYTLSFYIHDIRSSNSSISNPTAAPVQVSTYEVGV